MYPLVIKFLVKAVLKMSRSVITQLRFIIRSIGQLKIYSDHNSILDYFSFLNISLILFPFNFIKYFNHHKKYSSLCLSSRIVRLQKSQSFKISSWFFESHQIKMLCSADNYRFHGNCQKSILPKFYGLINIVEFTSILY